MSEVYVDYMGTYNDQVGDCGVYGSFEHEPISPETPLSVCLTAELPMFVRALSCMYESVTLSPCTMAVLFGIDACSV